MKKKILLLVASIFAIMLVLGCPNESTEPEVEEAYKPNTVEATAMVALEYDVASDRAFDIEDLVAVGIKDVKSDRYGDKYSDAFILANGTTAALAEDFMETAYRSPWSGWNAVIIALQAAVTKVNAEAAITEAPNYTERNAMGWLGDFVTDGAMTETENNTFIEYMARVGIVGTPSAIMNYQTQVPLYIAEFINLSGGAGGNAETAAAILDVAGDFGATEAQFTAAVNALNAAVLAVNTATPPVARPVIPATN